jgi:hypothetical protein
MMRKFESIDDLKEVAEFFPRGKIIPRRIMKGPRRYSSKIRFDSDCWVLNTPKGHVCASNNSQGYMIHIKGIKNAEIVGSPYTTSGASDWIGNGVLSDSEWMVQLNAKLKEHYATPSPAPEGEK